MRLLSIEQFGEKGESNDFEQVHIPGGTQKAKKPIKDVSRLHIAISIALFIGVMYGKYFDVPNKLFLSRAFYLLGSILLTYASNASTK